jgi:hypothetical protein
MSNEQLLEFPCEIPIKVMGRDEESFETAILAIFDRHLENIEAASIRSRPSSTGKFLSITVTFTASSQQQLDALYRDLTAHEQVLFCL